MERLKAVHYFFILLTIMVIIGEGQRIFSNQKNEKGVKKETPQKFSSKNKRAYIFPIKGKSQKDLIGFFGEPRGGGKRKHEGIDILAKRGTPVVAVANGTVTKVKTGGNGGKQVWMEDAEKQFTFYYAHLHHQSVREGQKIKQGDELGTVGNTGNAKGASPHLHFGIYMENRWAVDPLDMLP